jgi:hypothetical protein
MIRAGIFALVLWGFMLAVIAGPLNHQGMGFIAALTIGAGVILGRMARLW